MIVVIMGVSGSGKTTVGKLFAERLGCEFADADDYHSKSNKEKMHAGKPLDDRDRQPWLEKLHEIVETHIERGEKLVLACSALKSSYRRTLSKGNPEVVFVFLKVDYETIAKRLEKRKHAFMNAALLKSQFDTLEVPGDAITVDAGQAPEKVVDEIVLKLN